MTSGAASRIKKPRCFLVYALAPPEISPGQANDRFNEFLADRRLPMVLFHDHFIGKPGGAAIFFVETPAERDVLLAVEHLAGWRVEIRPLIYSFSPGAFDEQIAFTLRAYRGLDWEAVRNETRPAYGDPQQEAQTAQE